MQPRRVLHFMIFALLLCAAAAVANAQALAPTPSQGTVRITLEDAIQIALTHNHTLLAERTTINQSQAQEITANLRPNPVLTLDSQFLPIFNPGNFSATYIDETAQFDAGISYLF